MIDFPNNPTVGQQFTSAGVTWTWDGFKWTATGLNVAYLPLAGGTMLGPITLQANPVGNLDAAPKQYVDALSMGYPLGDNRIINGDMRIDQRNNGASGTAVNVFTVDRWWYGASQAGKGTWQRNSNSGVVLGGFPYGLLFTSASAFASAATDYFQVSQNIEADMISDFQWGTASAQPVTLSFLAYSSLTGVFSGCLGNYAATRNYPFTYSIPVANTWTKITITIPGDTGGTWVMSGNGGAATLHFDLGSGSNYRSAAGVWTASGGVGVTGSVSVVGTNGAILLLTGVKLEVGSVATPFNRQSLAKSLADCQRYYQRLGGSGVAGNILVQGYGGPSGVVASSIGFPTMRAVPTINSVGVSGGFTASNCTMTYIASVNTLGIQAAAVAQGQVNFYNNADGAFTLDAEL